MKLCAQCQRFSLHAIARGTDGVYAIGLLSIYEGAREECVFCLFLSQQVQEEVLTFPVHPSRCWLRFTASEKAPKGKHGLGLDGLTLCLADSSFLTKSETKGTNISLGLAALPGL